LIWIFISVCLRFSPWHGARLLLLTAETGNHRTSNLPSSSSYLENHWNSGFSVNLHITVSQKTIRLSFAKSDLGRRVITDESSSDHPYVRGFRTSLDLLNDTPLGEWSSAACRVKCFSIRCSRPVQVLQAAVSHDQRRPDG
jgi:hypothetical protein